MRASILSRARYLSIHNDGGISEAEKRKWIPVRLQKAKPTHFPADDIRLIREMRKAGYGPAYIGRIFGFGKAQIDAICDGRLYRGV